MTRKEYVLRTALPRMHGAAVPLLALSAVLTGCRNSDAHSVEAKIAAQIKQCPESSSCKIKVSDVTPFAWDRAFVFYRSTKAERESVLGLVDPGYVDDSRQLIFLKDKKVVYFENRPSDFEAAATNEVLFGPDVERVPPLYDTFQHDAVFRVKERPVSKNGPYYMLEQVH